MKLQRSVVLPSLFLALGSAIACGDDDTPGSSNGGVVTLPGSDAGVLPSKPNDAGEAGTTEGGVAAPPTITTTTLPPVVGGGAITEITLEATGAPPITWGVTKGGLPPGLTLSTGGKLSGTPTAAGDFVFTVTATNAEGSDTVDLTLKVTSPPVDAYVLADGKLSAFATSFPAGAAPPATLTGIVAGDVLVSLDRRPQNGWLYALGWNNTAKSVQLYAIDPEASLATPIGASATATPALAGLLFGMDVNPSVDRVRVVTSSGDNFRLNPNTGAFIDLDGNGANGNTPDGDLNGGTSTAGQEVAYTNNQPNNANLTTLYTVAQNTLYIQNPPNNGVLTAPHPMNGVETVFGFDIPKGVNVAASNTAVASGSGLAVVKLTGNAAIQLASVDLTNGTTTAIGAFPFTGIAGFTLAPAASRAVIALNAAGTSLVRFDETTPGTTTTVTINGVAASETLVGIDLRPATGQLFALGINALANIGTLYILDPQTGAASVVGSANQVAFTTDGVTPVDFPDPAASSWGFDFNPTVDRIRVTTSTNLNFRINPLTGAPIDGSNATGTNPDGALSAGLDEVSCTNGPPSAAAPGVTTEYGLSAADNALHIVNPPNNGVVGAAIPIKVAGAALDFNAVGGFDIPLSVKTATANAPVTEGSGYAALTVGGTTNLYKINLVDGTATSLGALVGGVRGLTVGR